jgi:hypothetical protein
VEFIDELSRLRDDLDAMKNIVVNLVKRIEKTVRVSSRK